MANEFKIKNGLVVSGSADIEQDLTVRGKITADQLNISIVSSSVMYESGSTKFGDSLDDNHTFTGSINITGSINLNGQTLGTGKLDETTFNTFTSSYKTVSGSIDTRLDDLETFSSSIDSNYVSEGEFGTYTGSLNSFTSSTLMTIGALNNESASIRNNFNSFTSSYTNVSSSLDTRLDTLETLSGSFTGSFSGSFKGDGTNLYNIPASGVTGLNLTQIADGSVTASVSNTNGLRVNSNSEITGSLIVTNGITGSIDYSNITNKPTLVSGSSQIDINATTGYSTFSSSISSSIGSLSSSVATNDLNQNTRLGNLEISTSSLNSFTSSALTRVSAIETSTGSLNTFTSSASGRLTSLESASSSIRSNFNSFTASYTSVSTSFDSRIDNLETLSGSFTGSINGSLTGSAYLDYIVFNSSSAATLQNYMLQANTTDKTLDLRMGNNATLQLGQELYSPPIVNKSGADLNDGDLVMVNPAGIAQGNRISVIKAIANGTYAADTLVGVLTEDVANNAEGFATWFGYVRNISKTHLQPAGETWVEGNVLYANPTIAGKLTNVFPTAPNLRVTVATVTSINGNNVTILVNFHRRTALKRAHDVIDNSTTSSYGDILVKSGSVWTNSKSLNGNYSVTGSLIVTNGITGSIDYSNITNKPTLVSGSLQINITGTTGYSTFSSSIATTTSDLSSSIATTNSNQDTRLGNLETSTSSLNSFTSSALTRVNAIETATSSLNSFTSSIATTIKNKLNTETVISGSIQVDITSTTGYSTFSSSISSSVGSLSGSIATTDSNQNTRLGNLETSTGSLNSFTSSIATTIKNKLNSENVVSGSSQIDITSTTGYSTFSSSIATTTLGTKNRVDSIEAKTGSYATTGSNIFQGTQTITGSLYITQDLIVAGSSSIQHISSSVLNIADNIITVNAQNPSIRFGGLAVIDSGSAPQVSGSILFDSVENQWIFVHQNQLNVTSSMLIMGPETYNNLGNETHLSNNRIPKSVNDEHIGDSNITDTGTKVSINSNTEITGSLLVTSTIVSQMTPLVSGSGQISYTGITNIPSGLVSSSLQVLSGSGIWSGSSQLPSGVVSGSSQVLGGTGIWSGSAQLPSGVVSGSSQITYSGISGVSSGIVSGSSQVAFGGITGVPSGLVSGSSQVLLSSGIWSGSAQLPSGVVSSSLQTIANLPVGTVSGSSQVLSGTGIWSGSAQLPSGVVSGSSQVLLSSGVVSGSYVSSITGTANQVVASVSTGAVTLSLPQSIATTSSPTFGGITLTGALGGTSATFSGGIQLTSNGSSISTTYGGVTTMYQLVDAGGGIIKVDGDNTIRVVTNNVNRFQINSTAATFTTPIAATSAVFSSTISASNFSGTSSGTNTGDQTLSGLGGVPTSGYSFGTAFSLGTMYVATGAQTTVTSLLGVYSNGYTYTFGASAVQSWLGLGTMAYAATSSYYLASNPNGYITGISFANVSSKPTTISGYGITDAITTGNISSQSVSTSTYASYLNALTNYSWTSSSLPNTYHQGITSAFVGPSEGWQNYGSVMTMRTYSGGGGSLQLYTPYGPSNGGDSLQVRFGNYNVSSGNSWTGWKTLIDSGTIGSQSVSYATTAGALTSMNISQFTNNSAYITGISFANVSSKPTTISGYGITDAITTSNISSQSVSYATSAGSASSATSATFATNSSKLYSTDSSYSYTSGAPYYGYLTYDGTYWQFKVSPATPANVRVYTADTLGGASANQTGGGNTIVQRDANGYIQTSYYYASGGGSERNTSGMGYFAGHNTGDYYYRSYTAAAAAALLSGQSMNISGTATNITAYTINQSVGSSNSPTFAGITLSGPLYRNAAGTGYLSGGYASAETGSSTGAIYTIGGSYYPTSTSLNNMYGIGYTNISGNVSMTSASGWGMYVAANGSIGVWLGGEGTASVFKGNILPHSNNSYNLGSASYGWANVYTNDLHLSNMNKPEGNDIDGTNGNWTIQEGEENLYIINNRNGKKFKISLEEIK